MALAFSSHLLAYEGIVISGRDNIVIVSSSDISIGLRHYIIEEKLNTLSVSDIPKKVELKGVRTEKTDTSDPRLINNYLAYCDRKSQLPTYKEHLNNPFSGYPRLLELYNAFFKKNAQILSISGNPVPLSLLNEKLLGVLGRQTDEPLDPNETVSDEMLLNAFIRAWYEKNSN